MHHAVDVGGAHQERVDHRFLRRRQPAVQIMHVELVHQEADGPAMHAVDRLAGAHVLVQRLQHQPVAAERHDDIGIRSLAIAVELGELGKCCLRFGAFLGDEGDLFVALWGGHRTTNSLEAPWKRTAIAPRLVYTTLASLVETHPASTFRVITQSGDRQRGRPIQRSVWPRHRTAVAGLVL